MEERNFNVIQAEMRETYAKLQTCKEEERAALQAKFENLKAEREIALGNEQAKCINREQPKTFSLCKALREAMQSRKQFELRSALTAAGLAGKAVEVEIQNILEPLYAKSVLQQLGVRWYKGMPMGDISIPVMNGGTVAWKAETGATADGTPTFGTNIVLKPKRLCAYFDISEQMILQDTVGVEDAIKRDAVNALKDKLEATIFGNAAGGDNYPAGIFYGQTLQDATSFAKVCGIEAGVEDANVYGEMKYLLSTKAKADLRSMAKSSKNTQLVMEGGEVDGVPALTTSNVKDGNKGIYCYGDFSNLAVAVWKDLIFKVDDSVAYGNGLIRIYVSGYFDAKVLRGAAFAFGDTRYVAHNNG